MPRQPTKALSRRIDQLQVSPPLLRPLPDRQPPTPQASAREQEVLERVVGSKEPIPPYAGISRPPGFGESVRNIAGSLPQSPLEVAEAIKGFVDPLDISGEQIRLVERVVQKIRGTPSPRERAEAEFGRAKQRRLEQRGRIQYDEQGRAINQSAGRKFR
jgi:hypothetical protein